MKCERCNQLIPVHTQEILIFKEYETCPLCTIKVLKEELKLWESLAARRKNKIQELENKLALKDKIITKYKERVDKSNKKLSNLIKELKGTQ